MFKSRSHDSRADRKADKARPADQAQRESKPRPLDLHELTKVTGGMLPKGGWSQK